MVQDRRLSRTPRSLANLKARACGSGFSKAESLSAGLSNDIKSEHDPDLASKYAAYAVK